MWGEEKMVMGGEVAKAGCGSHEGRDRNGNVTLISNPNLSLCEDLSGQSVGLT